MKPSLIRPTYTAKTKICATCKFKIGTFCRKINELVFDYDSCPAWVKRVKIPWPKD